MLMKRKIIATIYIILIIVTLKLLYNSIVNTILIDKYNNGEYLSRTSKNINLFKLPRKLYSKLQLWKYTLSNWRI